MTVDELIRELQAVKSEGVTYGKDYGALPVGTWNYYLREVTSVCSDREPVDGGDRPVIVLGVTQ